MCENEVVQIKESKEEKLRKFEENEKTWRLTLEEVEEEIAVLALYSQRYAAQVASLKAKWTKLRTLRKAEMEGLGWRGMVKAFKNR